MSFRNQIFIIVAIFFLFQFYGCTPEKKIEIEGEQILILHTGDELKVQAQVRTTALYNKDYTLNFVWKSQEVTWKGSAWPYVIDIFNDALYLATMKSENMDRTYSFYKYDAVKKKWEQILSKDFPPQIAIRNVFYDDSFQHQKTFLERVKTICLLPESESRYETDFTVFFWSHYLYDAISKQNVTQNISPGPLLEKKNYLKKREEWITPYRKNNRFCEETAFFQFNKFLTENPGNPYDIAEVIDLMGNFTSKDDKNEKVIEAIKPFLSSGDYYVRSRTLKALSRLSNEYKKIRGDTFFEWIKNRATWSHVLVWMHDSDPGEFKELVLRHDYTPYLITIAQSEDKYGSQQAIEALGKIGSDSKEAIPILVEFLDNYKTLDKNNNFFSAKTVVEALGGIGTPAEDKVPEILRFFKETDSSFYRKAAIIALFKINPYYRNDFLDLVLKWIEISQNSDAIESLFDLESLDYKKEDFRKLFITSLGSKYSETRQAGLEALVKFFPQDHEIILNTIILWMDNQKMVDNKKADCPDCRHHGLEIFIKIADIIPLQTKKQNLIDSFSMALEDTNPYTCQNAKRALLKLDPDRQFY